MPEACDKSLRRAHAKRNGLETAKWFFLSKAIPGIFAFIILLAQIRILDVHQYVELTLATPLCILSSNIGTSGLRQLILRDHSYSTHLDDIRLVSRQSGPALLLPSVISAAATLAVTSEPALAFGTAVYTMGLSFAALQQTLIQGSGDARRLTLFETTRFALALGATLGAILWTPHAALALGAGGVPFVASAVVADVRQSRRLKTKRTYSNELTNTPAESLHLPTGSRAFTLTMTLWMVASTALAYLDRFLLEVFGATAVAVATYSKIYDCTSRFSSFVLFPILLGAHPQISRAYRHNRNTRVGRSLILKASTLLLCVTSLMMLSMALCWNILAAALKLPFGSRTTFLVLASSASLWILAQIIQKELELNGEERWLLIGVAGTVALNGALNLLVLTNGYGLMSVALVNLISVVGYCGYVLEMTNKLERVSVWNSE